MAHRLLVLLLVGITACSSGYDVNASQQTDGGSGTDAGTSNGADGGTVMPPAMGFTFTAAPPHMTLDPGDSFPITVNIVRASSFTSDVKIIVNNLPNGVQAGALTIPSGQSSGQFFLTAPGGAPPAMPIDATLQLVAEGGGFSKDAEVGFRLGSLLYASSTPTPTNGKTPLPTITLPAFATQVVIKAWGGGGASGGASQPGGNGQCVAQTSVSGTGGDGGAGGGAGFGIGTFPAMGAEVLTIAIGAGGAGCALGGGLSSVSNGTTPVLIAGGGGGGAMGTAINPGGGYIDVGGANAYGGGGTTGQAIKTGHPYDGNPGTQTAGGASPDANGAGASMKGGASKSRGPGVGGAGYYGGGSGSCPGTAGCGGGGGGSGYALPTGTSVTLTTAVNGTVANSTDPDYETGIGAGGTNTAGMNVGGQGGPGRVVIRLAKP